jgi:phosphoserine aminotransferase
MKFYLTPGPSELYPTVGEHLRTALRQKIASISHRSSDFKAIYRQAESNLRQLLAIPDDFHIVFASSANEVWERIVQNTVENHSTHLVNGAFSKRFAEFSALLGKQTHIVSADWGKGFTTQDLENLPPQTEMIAVIQNETSTGVSSTEALLPFLRQAYPDALLVVDAVSSLPYYQPNYACTDSLYFSVQKAFGLPAGLGVWIYSNRTLQKAHQIAQKSPFSQGTYHKLCDWHAKAQEAQTPETPNVLAIYLLAQVCADMLQKGIDALRRETNYKAILLYDALEKSPHFQPLVADANHRSKTVLVANVLQRRSDEVLPYFEQAGLVIGKGYGKYAQAQIRIANFPTHSKELAEKLADAILDMP